MGGNDSVDCFVVKVCAGIAVAFFGSCWGPRLAWWASKVEGKIFNGVSRDVTEGLRDRCVREIGLNEFAALWVAIGGRFVRCLNAKKPKGERRGFHPGEVRGEGKVVYFRGVGLRGWLVLWVVIRKGILAGRCVVFHAGERWTCES